MSVVHTYIGQLVDILLDKGKSKCIVAEFS